VAVSCLADVNTKNALPPIAAYYAMRIGTLPIVPFFLPGDINLAQAVLLANHDPIVAGKSLTDAIYATEELEETAKLFLMLRGSAITPLSEAQMADVQRRFPVEMRDERSLQRRACRSSLFQPVSLSDLGGCTNRPFGWNL